MSENQENERWADIEDSREQCEAMLGMKLYDWQWDWVLHFSRGEKLVRDESKRYPAYKWAPRETDQGV